MPSTKTHKTVGDIKPNRTSLANESDDPPTSQRLQLFWVWLAAGSAVAAMTAVGWYTVVKLGGVAPGGDMTGPRGNGRMAQHSAMVGLAGLVGLVLRRSGDRRQLPAAKPRLDALHPPSVRAVVRRNHRTCVVVAVGCLALGAGVGNGSRAQRAAVASVLVLTAASGDMHWVLSGFHYRDTFFGSWPAMLALVWTVHCRLRGALRSSRGRWCARWSGGAAQRLGSTRHRGSQRGSDPQQRGDLAPRSSVGSPPRVPLRWRCAPGGWYRF